MPKQIENLIKSDYERIVVTIIQIGILSVRFRNVRPMLYN